MRRQLSLHIFNYQKWVEGNGIAATLRENINIGNEEKQIDYTIDAPPSTTIN